jgi:hypothetical protein
MRFTLFRVKPQFLHKHPPALCRYAGCGLVHPNFSAPYKFNVRIKPSPEFMQDASAAGFPLSRQIAYTILRVHF